MPFKERKQVVHIPYHHLISIFLRTSSVFRYVIIYKEASSSSGEMQDATKQQTRVLRDLKTYTKYTISVYAENKAGVRGATAVTEATTVGGGTLKFTSLVYLLFHYNYMAVVVDICNVLCSLNCNKELYH